MKVLIYMTVVTLMVILPFAESNSVKGKIIPWIKLEWNEKKSYCKPDEIHDIMAQVCRNEYQYWYPKPSSPKNHDVSIHKRCCNKIGCSAIELRTYCIREEQRKPANFALYANLPYNLRIPNKHLSTSTEITTTTSTQVIPVRRCPVSYRNGMPHIFAANNVWELKKCMDRLDGPVLSPDETEDFEVFLT